MDAWGIVGAVVVATALLSAVFWLVVMPRTAARAFGRPAAFAVMILFAVLVLGAPVAGLYLLPERSAVVVCALIVGWAAAVRGVGWVLARKYFVPRLRSGSAAPEKPAPPPADAS